MRARVKSVVIDILGVKPEQVFDTANLSDLTADSLEVTQLIMELEAEFDIEVSDETSSGLLTVGDLANLIVELKSHQAI